MPSVHSVVALTSASLSVVWQLIETWKKLVLVGFFALLKPGSLLQVISAFVVSATFSLLVGVAAPYKDASDDYFAKACSYALTMLFFFVTVLKMGLLTEQVDSLLTDELRYRFSFDAALISAGMIVSIVGTLPLAAVMAAHRLLQEAQAGQAARCSESSAASSVRQSAEESSARAELMHGWPSWVSSLRPRSTRRSDIRQEGIFGSRDTRRFSVKRALNLRLSRTHGNVATQSAVDESDAAVNAPTRQGRAPPALPLPNSQGKLRASEVTACRNSMTAGDELHKDFSETKERPGRLSSCRSSSKYASSSCSASGPRDSSDGNVRV